jgi:hypothetical protein
MVPFMCAVPNRPESARFMQLMLPYSFFVTSYKPLSIFACLQPSGALDRQSSPLI